jgi:hypothetical protein
MLLVAFACHGLLLADTALLVHVAQNRERTRTMEAAPPSLDRDFRQTRGNRWLAAYFPAMSRGSLTCFDDYDIAQSTELRGDLPAEEYLRDAGAGTVRRVTWTPGRIDLHVELTRPSRVIVNQNAYTGWRANVGDVVSADGLLAVDLPAGTHELTLQFWPRSAVAGMWTTLFGLVAVTVFAFCGGRVRTARERMVALALAAGPLLVVPLSFVL